MVTEKRKGDREPARDEPHYLARTGERDASGRFLSGHRGMGGRPRSLDFRALITQERADTLASRLLAVFDAMCRRAEDGDVAAAKLLLDRVCVQESEEPQPRDVVRLTHEERVTRLRGLLGLDEGSQ